MKTFCIALIASILTSMYAQNTGKVNHLASNMVSRLFLRRYFWMKTGKNIQGTLVFFPKKN